MIIYCIKNCKYKGIYIDKNVAIMLLFTEIYKNGEMI
jgi:hypothetical protein